MVAVDRSAKEKSHRLKRPSEQTRPLSFAFESEASSKTAWSGIAAGRAAKSSLTWSSRLLTSVAHLKVARVASAFVKLQPSSTAELKSHSGKHAAVRSALRR